MTDTEVVEASVVDVVDAEVEEGEVDEVIMMMILQIAGGEQKSSAVDSILVVKLVQEQGSHLHWKTWKIERSFSQSGKSQEF